MNRFRNEFSTPSENATHWLCVCFVLLLLCSRFRFASTSASSVSSTCRTSSKLYLLRWTQRKKTVFDWCESKTGIGDGDEETSIDACYTQKWQDLSEINLFQCDFSFNYTPALCVTPKLANKFNSLKWLQLNWVAWRCLKRTHSIENHVAYIY